ncbi:MAG: sugar-binding transcriptional regulator [Acidothermaceae bacterium]
MRPSRERDLLVKAARMYFIDGLSQQDVAGALGTTRSNVSRILAAAREQGIVEIRINEPIRRAYELEDELVAAYPSLEARVLANQPRGDVVVEVGQLAAHWLVDRLEPKQRVAVSWGGTLQAMVRAVPPTVMPDVEVVQLVGGLSSLTLHVSGQELVRELADRLGCQYRYLHAPALFESAPALLALRNEPAISTALDAARTADIACVGVGVTGVGSSAEIIEALALSRQERKAFDATAPIGDICARFFDGEGHEVDTAVHDRVLAVGLDDLRAIPTVLAVAVGAVKGPAIRAALRGQLVDVLVCDEAAAHAVLSTAKPASG